MGEMMEATFWVSCFGGSLLFITNTGAAQQGTVQLRSLDALGVSGSLSAEVIGAAGASTAQLESDGKTLQLSVDAGDALVVRLA